MPGMLLKLESRTDIMLALMGTAPQPIQGITRLVKLLFLAQREAGVEKLLPANEKYYGYRPYKIGPFSADVYEDVELLESVGLIRGTPGRAEMAEEIEEWRARFADDLTPEPSSAERDVNRVFQLTEEGRACAQSILDSMPNENRAALEALRKRCDHLSLRNLLVYVYTRYPEMTQASEIKEQLGLG